MAEIVINGGRRLSGRLKVQGSKNAVLPLIAASILCGGECVLKNCPDISDVSCALEIINALGGYAKREIDAVIINTANLSGNVIPKELMRKMRSSIMFLGALTARMGKAQAFMPGGCEIGLRPVDIHIEALKELNISVKEENCALFCEAEKITGSLINLPFPSVGATENIIMASALANGETVIKNAAREPEIRELQNFINKMGGKVSGAGTDTVVISGVKKLHGAETEITGDRIVCATYLFSAAATGGEALIDGVLPLDLTAVLDVLQKTGCDIETGKDFVKIKACKRLNAVNVKTEVFPGFPTDVQALFTALMATADGTSEITEQIFENRFRHIKELKKMGADIKTHGNKAIICGKDLLSGTEVTGHELRGSAALIIAGLAANGRTVLKNTEFLDRGYVSAETALSILGADIKRKG